MAGRTLPKQPTETLPNIGAATEELEAAIRQLGGLQSFLTGLGEADEHGSSVVSLNHLCFGFHYLLDATEATARRAYKLLTAKEVAD